MRRETAGYGAKSWLNRQEFVIVGWSDRRNAAASHLGALLLGYYTDEGDRGLATNGTEGYS
jgi:ATP-dependent DNA ligase